MKTISANIVNYISESCGKSRYIVPCPYCDTRNTVYSWSAYSVGKKCTKCKALIRLNRYNEFEIMPENERKK